MARWSEKEQRIVEMAFAAAVDDSLWDKVAEEIALHLDSIGTFLGVIDTSSMQPRYVLLSRATVRAADEYSDGMGQLDPQVRVVMRLDHGAVFCDRDHLDLSDPAVADYMHWQIDRTGWHNHATIAARLDENNHSGMSFHFGKGDAAKAVEAKKRLLPLGGAIAQALQLGFLHNDKLTHEYWLGLSAKLDSRAAFMISDAGNVMRMNLAAEQMVERGEIVQVSNGQLTCATSADRERLRRLVNDAIDRVEPRPGATLLGSPLQERLFVRASPVVATRRAMVVDEPAALVTMRAPMADQGQHGELWKEMFGLTDREATVADQLKLGHSAIMIAQNLGLSPATVQTHIKMIHEKTETRRNAELAHLLTLIASQG